MNNGRKKIIAKFRTHCYECGDSIEIGDEIIWDMHERVSWHKECDRGPDIVVRDFD